MLAIRHAVLPMNALREGWHELVTDAAMAGDRYSFVLGDGRLVPDPASRFQPDGVHGPSEVIDPASYQWESREWIGRPWHEAVIYELHLGTFSSSGTFLGAIEKLEHLAKLGVTVIELMPVASFPGKWNWGYDGVLPFAPTANYGRPNDMKAFVDAAHARGLMVVLDVVYNHFGPDGNYLPSYAQSFFTERHKTPWGAAINFDGLTSTPVRDFFIQNALFWLEEYQLDGLRFDAVHAIADDSDRHILAEISEEVRRHYSSGRQVHLILENAANEARWLESGFTAQWNDDFHHVLHTVVSGENEGYYADFHGDERKLATALSEGFAFQGEFMADMGVPRGQPSKHLAPTAFVSFIQNHDQIGNRALGERISEVVCARRLRAISAIHLLSPQVPLLFQGEEWAASTPFPFFCDFPGELGKAVCSGRQQEFSKFTAFQGGDLVLPNPISETTFLTAKLDWSEREKAGHREWLDWYRNLLAIRRAEILPLLPHIKSGGRSTPVGPWAIRVEWQAGEGRALVLEVNLSDEPCIARPGSGTVIFEEGEFLRCWAPWGVRWSASQRQ